MERRDFLTSVGVIAAAAVADAAARADEPHHHHPGGKNPPSPPMSKELKAVAGASQSCLGDGAICLAHCNDNLGAGDTSMAGCQRAVMNMLAVCEAMFKTASYHSADPKSLKSLARTCADFCRTCAKACEPHASHHIECKNCMDSCQRCAKACDAYAA